LAIKNILLEDVVPNTLLPKVVDLIKVLKTAKGAAHLRKYCSLKAVKKK
jgi:hypothetical protein